MKGFSIVLAGLGLSLLVLNVFGMWFLWIFTPMPVFGVNLFIFSISIFILGALIYKAKNDG
jgi:hypothetical protein